MWTLPGKWVVRVWPAKIEDVSIPNVDITNEHWIWMCLRKGHRTNNSLLRGGSHHVTTKDRGFNWKKVRYQCCHSWRKQRETTKCARFWKWVILPNQSSNHIRPWPSAIFRFGSLQIDSMDWFKGTCYRKPWILQRDGRISCGFSLKTNSGNIMNDC